DSFSEGNFHQRIKYQSNDEEFEQITQAFNEMAETIEQLVDEVFISDLDKKDAELQLIQSQVNPHFLYNTLSSISRLGKLGEIEKMHKMIMELAKFYRLSLNQGEIFISIYNEIEQVKSYNNILKIKYGKKFDVTFDINPEILNYRTVKFILQPFVENSLEHAWFKGHLYVRIIAYQEEDHVVLKVIDNGIGMKDDIIKQVLNENEVKRGYGVHNVNERIKLHYGNSYGVEIFSIINGGTTVKITMPVLKGDK
ncbi:MAG: sensor histidine kinase, partial [Halanaerobiales bacterium]